MFDIAIPNKNEEEFVKVAKELGLETIIFLYNLNDFERISKESKIKELAIKENISIKIGTICNNFKELNRALQKRCLIFCNSNIPNSSSELRNMLRKGVYGIFEMEISQSRLGKDHTHYPRSGLNQVLVKIMKQNNINYFESFSSILNVKGTDRINLLRRMRFNEKICKKYKVEVNLASFARKPNELRYFTVRSL